MKSKFFLLKLSIVHCFDVVLSYCDSRKSGVIVSIILIVFKKEIRKMQLQFEQTLIIAMQ